VAKDGTRKGAWAAGAAFAAFSAAVTLGLSQGADLWARWTVQERYWGSLDGILGVFSLLGTVEAMGLALLMLLAGLFLRGRRALAGRILAAFLAAGVLELAIKFYLPQLPISEGLRGTEDYAPLVAVDSPNPYPSGHVLRGVIVLGAMYLLSGNWLLRAGFLMVLAGIAVNRVYFGLHWVSDVVGGALLGLAALLWAFGKEDPGRSSR
jgi:undecaprenyl-diphosphatase